MTEAEEVNRKARLVDTEIEQQIQRALEEEEAIQNEMNSVRINVWPAFTSFAYYARQGLFVPSMQKFAEHEFGRNASESGTAGNAAIQGAYKLMNEVSDKLSEVTGLANTRRASSKSAQDLISSLTEEKVRAESTIKELKEKNTNLQTLVTHWRTEATRLKGRYEDTPGYADMSPQHYR